jgi:hypothetical protein
MRRRLRDGYTTESIPSQEIHGSSKDGDRFGGQRAISRSGIPLHSAEVPQRTHPQSKPAFEDKNRAVARRVSRLKGGVLRE